MTALVDSKGRVYKNGFSGKTNKGRFKGITNDDRVAFAEARRDELRTYLESISTSCTVKELVVKFRVSAASIRSDLTIIDGWNKINQNAHTRVSDPQVPEIIDRLNG